MYLLSDQHNNDCNAPSQRLHCKVSGYNMGLMRLSEDKAIQIGPNLDRATATVIEPKWKPAFTWLGLLEGMQIRHDDVYKRRRGPIFSSSDVPPPFVPTPVDVREMLLFHATTYLEQLNSFRWQAASGLCFLTLRDKAAPVVEDYLQTHFGPEWSDFVAEHDDSEKSGEEDDGRRTLVVNLAV